MNKKAQIFTVIAILLIGLTFISFQVFSVVEQRQETNARISTMESFLFSIEENLQRQMFISGFRAIFLAENEITTKGQYITNTNNFFQEAFFNGTVNGIEQDILLGATYNELIDSINQKADKINVNITLSNPILTISQVDPWNVKLTLTTNFTMQDQSNLARWEKQQVIISYIPIEGFLDPIYTLNSNRLVLNKIKKTPYSNFVQGSNISNLLNHTTNSYYINSTTAPSFLNRLEGNLNANQNGIESLVYLPKLSAQNIQTQDKSVVDYIYFSSNNPATSTITGMPSWFKIDNAHLGVYNN